MLKPEQRGCAVILVIGLLTGIFTGFLIGVNWSAWRYADIIARGYSEIIRTEDGGMFVRERGLLYELKAVKTKDTTHKELADKIDKLEKLEKAEGHTIK